MFNFFKRSREQQTIQGQSPRSPLVYGVNSNDMPEDMPKFFNHIEMENLRSVAANMFPASGSGIYASAIPDIFMRDFSLAENIEAGDQCAFDEWFGFFCALLLSKKGCIQTQTYLCSDLEKESNLFKRALGAEMTARSIEKLTVYKVRLEKQKADVMLGYAYDGMKTLVCPAAEISVDVTERLFSGCINNNKFVNPIEILKQPAYALQARRVALELEARQRDMVNQMVLCQKLQRIIETLKNRIPGEELNPFWTDSGITIPGTTVERPEQSATAQMLNSWLEDRIVVFPYDEERRFSGCHGVFNVENGNGNTEEQVIVPFNQAFAQMISTQRFGQRNNELMSADEWIQWLDRKTMQDNGQENSNQTAQQIHINGYNVTEDKRAYRIDITYQGNLYSKYYDVDHVERNSMLCMPIVAAWPKTRDDTRTWKDYYLYVRQIDKEGAATSEGIELTVLEPNREGFLLLKGNEFDRNRDDENGKYDWVTHTHDFPQFVQVTYHHQNVGVLFPRSQGNLLRPAAQPCIIAIDFGSTNTIAYRKMQNAMAEPLNIGQTAGVICEREMEPDSEEWTDMTLDFFNPGGWNQPLFLTILKIHGRHDVNFTEVLPLEEGSIPFTDKITITYSMRSRLITDELKWNRELETDPKPIQIARTRGYLKTIMMMYKWSAYKDGADLEQIEWRFAYPRSMSQTARSELTNVFAEFASHNAVRCTSEANAAGCFLQDDTLNGLLSRNSYQPLFVADPCMLIDIGGGTVDYSLWQSNRLVAEASMIGVAGDFALRNAILHEDQADVPANVELLRQLFPVNDDEEKKIKRIKNNLQEQLTRGNQAGESGTGKVSEKLIAYMEVRNDSRYGADASTINNMFKQLWTTNINDICESMKTKLPRLTERAAIRRYARRLKLYYALLLYFAGELAGAAMQEDKLRCTARFNIGLIGNGAKSVMNLKEQRERFVDSQLNQMLQRFFIMGMENTYGKKVPKINVQIIEPIKAKHEVAMGLCMREFTGEEEMEAGLQWMIGANHESVNQVVGGMADYLRTESQICGDDHVSMENWTAEKLKQRIEQAVALTENKIKQNQNPEVWRRKDTMMAEIIKNALNSD